MKNLKIFPIKWFPIYETEIGNIFKEEGSSCCSKIFIHTVFSFLQCYPFEWPIEFALEHILRVYPELKEPLIASYMEEDFLQQDLIDNVSDFTKFFQQANPTSKRGACS